MSAFSLDDLKVTLPLKAHSVPVPQFGAGKEAFVAELSMNEREQRVDAWWEQYKSETKKEDTIGFKAWVIAACLCDSDRNFLCRDAMEVSRTSLEFGKLGTIGAVLYMKAMEVNSMSAAEAEELEKN